MLECYIYELYKQYCQSIGKNIEGLNIDNDFALWINMLMIRNEKYKLFINEMIETNYQIYELDKGIFDSLKIDHSIIVTPFSNLFLTDNNFTVTNNNLLIESSNSNLIINANPYWNSSMINLVKYYDEGNNICLGMHGKNNDKDKVLKLSVIKEYQKKFLSSSEIIYETDNSDYYACIKSDIKVKKLLKRR